MKVILLNIGKLCGFVNKLLSFIWEAILPQTIKAFSIASRDEWQTKKVTIDHDQPTPVKLEEISLGQESSPSILLYSFVYQVLIPAFTQSYIQKKVSQSLSLPTSLST
jgi:hypothetical protein